MIRRKANGIDIIVSEDIIDIQGIDGYLVTVSKIPPDADSGEAEIIEEKKVAGFEGAVRRYIEVLAREKFRFATFHWNEGSYDSELFKDVILHIDYHKISGSFDAMVF